jgi:hypothetical protein
MWGLRPSITTVLLVLLAATAASAQRVPSRSGDVNLNATRYRWLQFSISSGRLAVGSGFGTFGNSITVNGRTERLNIHTVDNELVVQYDVVAPDEQFSLQVKSGNRIRLSRSARGGAAVVPVEFQQLPGEPLRLSVGAAGHAETYRMASLWHLLLAHPETCRRHLIPLLETFRPDWRIAEQALEAEEELFRMARYGQLPDRPRWTALVAQLSDDRFARREAADRALRGAGPVVLPFLRELDFAQLEPEQQSRLRRIIAALAQATDDDTSEQIAGSLIADVEVWLSLLSRPEEATRRLAAGQLERLCGRPLRFDPAAADEIRRQQLGEIRTKVAAVASVEAQRQTARYGVPARNSDAPPR